MHSGDEGASGHSITNFPSRVLLVAGLPVVLAGLRLMLMALDDFTTVGEATTIDETRVAAAEHDLDFVLVDSLTEDLDVLNVCRELSARAIVLVLAGDQPAEYLRTCLDAGAQGLLPRGAAADELAQAMRAAREGIAVVDPHLAERLAAAAHPSAPRLTPREHEVLRLLADGRTSRQIAETLGLSVNTVRGYVQNTLTKLQATNRLQAVEHARRRGLL